MFRHFQGMRRLLSRVLDAGGRVMATVKCALGKRGRASHEWNDGEKDHIYCLGWVDPMTDAPLPECVACPDFVDKAQDDLEAFYRRADNG